MKARRMVTDGDGDITYFDDGRVLVGDEKSAVLLSPEYKVIERWWKETPQIDGQDYGTYFTDETVHDTIQLGEEDDPHSLGNLALDLGHNMSSAVEPWMIDVIKANAGL